jgi:adenylosuccinate synthase
LDVLDTFERIKVAVAYQHPETGETLDSFPADLDLLSKVKIVYHEMPGWNKPTTATRDFYSLPLAAILYVEFIEKFVGVKIDYIGTGPDRQDMCTR